MQLQKSRLRSECPAGVRLAKEASVPSKKDARSQAEMRFEKAQKTTVEAKSVIENDRTATRKKTEHLRQLRLAKEASAGTTELDKKADRESGKAKRPV